MQVNNENKVGYKLTSLGWIPKEWEIYPVGKAFNICNNLRFPINEDVRNSMTGSYPYYGPTRIQGFINEYRVEGKYALIGEDGDHFLKWKELPMTLLVSGKFNVNNHAHLIQGNGISITEWFFYYFNHRELTTYLTRQGAGRYKLTKAALAKMPIPLPSLDEQSKITTILSTWDEAITKTQELITQLQRRNKGLMQQLLSGKKRLKGFENEWKPLKIYDVAKEVSLKNRDDKQLTVLSCTKYDGLVPSLEYFGRRVFGSDTSTYKVVPKEHFAYATNHIEEGSIGYQDIFEEALISPMYTVFKTSEKVNDDFFYKLLKSHQYIHQYCKRMEGSIDRRGGLRWDEFSKIPVHLPPHKEQTAIATIINKAMDDVKLQEQHLASLQQQKKGLMQKLLTGHVRVKI